MRTLLRRNLFLPLLRGCRYIFVYHDVSEPTSPHHHSIYSTTPSTFRRHVDLLERLFELVPLPELVGHVRGDRRGNLATITFDDGFSSVHDVVFPHLSSKGIPFAVFLNGQALEEDWLWCTDVILGRGNAEYMARLYDQFVDKDAISLDSFLAAPLDHLVTSSRLTDDYGAFRLGQRTASRTYMTVDQAKALHRQGVTIGSHTWSHKVLRHCSEDTLSREIEENQRYLERLLDTEVHHFAFPFGFGGTFDVRSVRLAKGRHRYLYSTQRVFFRLAEAGQPVLLPRIGLREESEPEMVATINLPFLVDRSADAIFH